MEGLITTAQTIAAVNQTLSQLLESLRLPTQPMSLTAEQFSAALRGIVLVGECMGTGGALSDEGPVADEITRYRLYLEQLRDLLPGFHAQLLTERNRLQTERTHLESATAWAHAAAGQTR